MNEKVDTCTLSLDSLVISDPDNVFIIDPIASVIPPNESRLFTVRFR